MTTTRAVRLSSVSLAALLSAGAVQAQDLTFELDPLIVESRDGFFGAADRATSMYVSDLELERARTGDLKDAFAGIASVSVGGGIPLAQKIFVNGVDMLNLGVTIDGAPQNNRAFHHVSANAIDPGLLKEVRADATVSPADAGPYALAGSVVFETLDPSDILAEGDNFGGNVRLSYGDNGETFQRALTLTGRSGGFSWLGYAKRATGEDYETGDGDVIGGTAADLDSVLGKVAYESDAGHRIEFSGLQLRDESLRQFRANFGGPAGPRDRLRVYDTTRTTYSLSYENTEATGLVDPMVKFGYSESDVIVSEPYDSNGLSWTKSATVQNTFNLGGDDNVVAGFDYQKRFGEYESPLYSQYFTEESRNTGIFAQARISPTERLKLSFGARYDWQDFEGVTGRDVSHSGASGNISASYAVTDALTLRGGVSSVFGGIDIEDNYLYERFVTPFDYDEIEPSRARNATLGFDYDVGAVSLGGELFLTRIENARDSGENFDFESRGFNLGATYGWASGFARATLSKSDVEIDGDRSNSYQTQDFGAPLGTVIALEVEQDTGLAGLRVGGGIDAALDYEMPSEPSEPTNDLDGYGVVNVFAEYVPPQFDNLTLRAEVDNLFDTDYADRATYGGEFPGLTTLNEPGRTISLTAVARF
ncbi:TonB-dependent receptor plug domain-containing protein [Roseivivax sediminis]|uniref:Hemoglobin/transferrin/lactoferrin receptor protein n=1 Tax=Roseivivax sediminis TaxID=936889 RepID=A0A1I1S6I8_9RHOB|nr:TonB-dependent receptor [Roseivivax sediminis]SFD42115.1 hemoglobin/transferrin/lactoferrin receptor protein [Roseivivax sediminis]